MAALDGIAPEEIYDALIDDELFVALPARLASAFGGRSTLLHWHYADGAAAVLAHSGYFSDSQLATYAEQFAPLDPWARAAAISQAPNQAMDLEEIVSLADYERSAFYNDYIRPMGDDTARCMGVTVANRFGQGMVAIQRGRGQTGFDPREVAALDEAGVHLRRMLAIRGKLDRQQRRLDTARAMLDALPHPALLVRDDGRLVEANGPAVALLASGKTLGLRHGRLTAVAQEAGLMRAIMAACARSAPAAGAVRVGATGTLMTVTPLKVEGGARLAMLLVSEPPASTRGADRLKTLYGLTDAEAAVAVLIAGGHALADIADQRGVSVQTVRGQLRAITDKMGCRRQAEVAATAMRVLSLG